MAVRGVCLAQSNFTVLSYGITSFIIHGCHKHYASIVKICIYRKLPRRLLQFLAWRRTNSYSSASHDRFVRGRSNFIGTNDFISSSTYVSV